jgi:putative flippase GtrA
MFESIISWVKNLGSITSIYQGGRFLIVGFSSSLIEIGILVFLVERIQTSYLHANIIAFVVTNLLNYFLSRVWVFTSNNNKILPEFFAFILFVSVGLAINQLCLWALVEYGELNYKISKVIAIGVTVGWNFLTRKHLVFKNKQYPL